jgi:hypothetical protein
MPLPMPSSTSPAITVTFPRAPASTAMPMATSAKTPATVTDEGRRAASGAKMRRPGICEKPTRPTANAAKPAP